MTKEEQIQKAKQFRALHLTPPILLLANAWDVVSAWIFEIEGFKAIGTTSAGISSTLGYPDGETMSLEENLKVVQRIVHKINLPVSADIETGYSTSPDGIALTAKLVIKSGAVGLNIEDSTKNELKPIFDISEQIEKIQTIRNVAKSEGIPLFINARTDIFLEIKEDILNLTKQSIIRANKYLENGADGIFIPDSGNLDKNIIKTLVKEIDGPLNIIAGENIPPIRELQNLGVARVSFGPRPMRASLALIRKIAREILDLGTYSNFTKESLGYNEVNKMLS